jgi:hypothetical protein
MNVGGADGELTCESGNVGANELLIIGDSFFAQSHQITAFLEDQARSAGVLEVGERYRDSSRLIANALALNGQGLLSQYRDANSEAPAKVVVLNGGGADVLLGSCDTVGPDCPLISDAVAAFGALLSQIGDDGVTDVVYVSYPDPQQPPVSERMDALRPLIFELCIASELPCHYVDLLPVFEGKYAEYIMNDGLNPTAAGSEAAAVAIWQLMEENCIAQ